MRLTELSRKPIRRLSSPVRLILLLFGSLALIQLPIQLLPNTTLPRISVVSGWREAAPAEVEQALVEPQENVLNGACPASPRCAARSSAASASSTSPSNSAPT